MNKNLTVIVLTYNEELHLARCLESVRTLASEIVVVDSFSTDKTQEIARTFGAKVTTHEFKNQADQFNWALDNVSLAGEWVLRLDADEYLLPELAEEIKARIGNVGSSKDHGSFDDQNIVGFYLRRRVIFMGRWIKHGGYYPTLILRLFRKGKGRSEVREMDEHIVVSEGQTQTFENDFVDENLRSLHWWTAKHNDFSTREARERIKEEEEHMEIQKDPLGSQTERKRWWKMAVYMNLPLFWRAFGYFFYRYFLRLGFLDGKEGLIFHFLQGGWHQFLIDAKIYEQEKGQSYKAEEE